MVAKRLVSFILTLVLVVAALPMNRVKAGAAPVMRALLVACDDFVTQPDTSPSSYNNLVAVRRALLYDARVYRSIRVSVNHALDLDAFTALVKQAYQGAKEGDINLFYLSTHGVQVDGETDFVALLSDGITETHLTGKQIHQALSTIPGTKIVILDACFSGAAINKGSNLPQVASVFTGPDFKVLTSAGALEPSFLWTDGAGTVQGGSFFAQALIEGISAEGRYAADINRDGLITLHELHGHQLRAYGASSPQVYPQEDNTIVFAYRARNTYQPALLRAVSGLNVDTGVITHVDDPLIFSYTLNRQARLAYQLVYQQEGIWRFNQPQSIADPGRGDGLVLPGRKEVSLRLQPLLEDLSGYLLMMLVTVVEDRSRPQACVLMSVQNKPLQSQPRLESAEAFVPGIGEEMAFILRHDGPVQVTARVQDEAGNIVAVLGYNMMSRPLHLKEEGSVYYWNGTLSDGSIAPAGKYRLSAVVRAGGERYEVSGAEFSLNLPSP